MNITQEQNAHHVILHLEGRFDFGARKVFKEMVEKASELKQPVILDLSNVVFLDSSALGLLVISHQMLKSKTIALYLVNPQTYVRQVLDLANVAKIIPIYGNLGEVPTSN